jgi:hypothetical protein
VHARPGTVAAQDGACLLVIEVGNFLDSSARCQRVALLTRTGKRTRREIDAKRIRQEAKVAGGGIDEHALTVSVMPRTVDRNQDFSFPEAHSLRPKEVVPSPRHHLRANPLVGVQSSDL